MRIYKTSNPINEDMLFKSCYMNVTEKDNTE